MCLAEGHRVLGAEKPVLFPCGRDELVGIVSLPELVESDLGVLIVVGGPQYRVGSHRQFVLLARKLADNGVATMRFDYRGMGDATGTERGFAGVDADVRAAVDEFLRAVPGLRRVALWALCDGASAACLYAPSDPRVAGVMLLNPWVRTEIGAAKTMLEHHYLKRLLDRRFWRKLVTGQVAIGHSARGLARAIASALSRRGVDDGTPSPLPDRMLGCLASSGVPFAIGLSGRDYVAREFDGALAQPRWRELAASPRCVGIERWDSADHTFSRRHCREAVERASIAWINAFRTARPVRG
jgi:exosortase A-associated hydrolase 1